MTTAAAHWYDPTAKALLSLEIDCEIEPGRPEVRRRDPGASDPAVPRHVETIEAIRVTELSVFDAQDESRLVYSLATRDGSLPAPVAEVLARQASARYMDDNAVRERIDAAILRNARP